MVILSDEVYERLHYTDVFPRIATLDHEIAKHTLSVGSVGKAFNATGWRVGYLIGNEQLIKHVHKAHTLLCYTTASPAQEAAAVGFEEAESRGFWKSNKESFQSMVESFCEVLKELGLPVRPKCFDMIKILFCSVHFQSNFKVVQVCSAIRGLLCFCKHPQDSNPPRLCVSVQYIRQNSRHQIMLVFDTRVGNNHNSWKW